MTHAQSIRNAGQDAGAFPFKAELYWGRGMVEIRSLDGACLVDLSVADFNNIRLAAYDPEGRPLGDQQYHRYETGMLATLLRWAELTAAQHQGSDPSPAADENA